MHDLSALTEQEAIALVSSREQLCVRYEVDADEAIAFAPRRRLPLVSVAAMALAACTPHDRPLTERAPAPPADARVQALRRTDSGEVARPNRRTFLGAVRGPKQAVPLQTGGDVLCAAVPDSPWGRAIQIDGRAVLDDAEIEQADRLTMCDR